MTSLEPLHAVIDAVGEELRSQLVAVRDRGGLSEEQYVRILRMQYHLTKDVQRYFLAAAAHRCMSGKRDFREFLFHFALEEEPHYRVAEADLKALGRGVGECPLDVKLWHAYFQGVVQDRPYIRLGAASVLETIGTIAADVIKELLATADFLSESNTRFVVIHMHETLPHGTQFLLELTNSGPSSDEVEHLVLGAKEGGLLYLRMAAWALGTDTLQERIMTEVGPIRV